MNRFQKMTRGMLWYEKLAFVVQWVLALGMVVLAVLQVAHLYTGAMATLLMVLGLCGLIVAQAVMQWRRNRKSAIVSLFALLFMAAAVGFLSNSL